MKFSLFQFVVSFRQKIQNINKAIVSKILDLFSKISYLFSFIARVLGLIFYVFHRRWLRHFDTSSKFELIKFPMFTYHYEPLSQRDQLFTLLCSLKRICGKNKETCLYWASFFLKFCKELSIIDIYRYNSGAFVHRISDVGLKQLLLNDRTHYACIRIQVVDHPNEEVIKFDTFQEFFDFMHFWGELTINVIDMNDQFTKQEKPVDMNTLMKLDEMCITLNPTFIPSQAYDILFLDSTKLLSNNGEIFNKKFISNLYKRHNCIDFGTTFNCIENFINDFEYNQKFGQSIYFEEIPLKQQELSRQIDFIMFLQTTDFSFIFDDDKDERVLNFLIILKRMEKLLQICMATNKDYNRLFSSPKETEEKEYSSKEKLLVYVQEIIKSTIKIKKETHKNKSFQLKMSEQYRIYKSLFIYFKNTLYPEYIKGSQEIKIQVFVSITIISIIFIIRILTYPYYILLLPLIVMYFFSRPQPRSFPTIKGWLFDFKENFWFRNQQRIKRIMTTAIIRRSIFFILILIAVSISKIFT